ncbi:hypothetical protein VM98_34085, partial [Streptomyces rubellomurinus subsp. indigoferus]
MFCLRCGPVRAPEGEYELLLGEEYVLLLDELLDEVVDEVLDEEEYVEEEYDEPTAGRAWRPGSSAAEPDRLGEV